VKPQRRNRLSRFRGEFSEQRLRSSGSVGVHRLPLVAQLGDGLVLPVRNEDRIEAEASRSARFVDDSTFQDAGPS
jgi:hypothetical protein